MELVNTMSMTFDSKKAVISSLVALILGQTSYSSESRVGEIADQ
jgi:hypothetical protein